MKISYQKEPLKLYKSVYWVVYYTCADGGGCCCCCVCVFFFCFVLYKYTNSIICIKVLYIGMLIERICMYVFRLGIIIIRVFCEPYRQLYLKKITNTAFNLFSKFRFNVS